METMPTFLLPLGTQEAVAQAGEGMVRTCFHVLRGCGEKFSYAVTIRLHLPW